MPPGPKNPKNVEVGLLGLTTLPPKPLTTLHIPVPTVGVFAAKVTVDVPQAVRPVWSAPALATVGLWLNVTFTSSVKVVQDALEIVQRSW